ncbi:nitroreductase family protein [Nitzschia inconspicua]|uniref:Nitroreductase family protein n=1 Tax=Nitzschia inconspicua TaxID=303405 RepID=A0A9K3LCH3_9STRA|nr:nitroreductase family protein [Nitzschia inconspicua]
MQIFRELIRYATLAPSSHNTQCWKFQMGQNSIIIQPDFSRKCPVVDPDDHHLYVSLGCAVENLDIAAKAHGFETQVDATHPEQGIEVKLEVKDATKQTNPTNDPLFDAIGVRQCNRGVYNGEKLSWQDLGKLQEAGRGEGVQTLLLTEKKDTDTIKDFVIKANSAQMVDAPFRQELKSWVRFNDKEAKSTGDGLFGKCMGHPSVPRWFGGLIFDYGVNGKSENQKISESINSSAGLAVIVSEKNDPVQWVEAGRVYERFALTAASLGIHNAHLNQPVEVTTIRPEFTKALNLPDEARPDLVLRFGRGEAMPKSFRRPLEAVIQQ